MILFCLSHKTTVAPQTGLSLERSSQSSVSLLRTSTSSVHGRKKHGNKNGPSYPQNIYTKYMHIYIYIYIWIIPESSPSLMLQCDTNNGKFIFLVFLCSFIGHPVLGWTCTSYALGASTFAVYSDGVCWIYNNTFLLVLVLFFIFEQ